MSNRPKIELFSSRKTNQVLATLAGDHDGVHDDKAAALEVRVRQLTEELRQQGVITIPFEKISRNPLNPRIIFPEKELQAFAEILREQGQLEPGILIELNDDLRNQIRSHINRRQTDHLVDLSLPYVLFNGERRWRAGIKAELSGFKAVIVSSPTIAQDLLEMQSKMAATTIFQKKLHPLEMAQFLISQIDWHYPMFSQAFNEESEVVYPRALNSLIVRFQREDKRTGQKKLVELNQLATAKRDEQQRWLSILEDDLEQAIIATLYRYQQKPATVNRHIFPLLKLPADLKQAVYEIGFEPDKIDEFKKLNAKALDSPEEEVVKIRQTIIHKAKIGQWDKQTISKQVAAIIAERKRKFDDKLEKVSVPTPIDKLERLNTLELSKLNSIQLKQCQQILESKLGQIRELLERLPD